MTHRLLSNSLVWIGVIYAECLSPGEAQRAGPALHWPSDAPVKEGVVVKAGEHFAMHLQFDSQLAGERAIAAVDRVWPEAMRLLGSKGFRYGTLLEIHLYDSNAQYAEVDAWLTGGNFKFNESFSHWNSLTAHVVMAPPLSEPCAGRIGLTSQTLEVLVHEAAHLATYSVVPSYRYHPTWFSEGLAMRLEQTTMRALGLLEDPADHPRYATQQLTARRLFDQARVPSISDLLVDQLGELSFHERYALWSDFMTVLTKQEKQFEAIVRDLRNMGGGPQMRARMSAVVIDRYGEEYLERELARELAFTPANWDESARSLETIGDEWEQMAFGSVDACAWRTQPMGPEDYVIEGAFMLIGDNSSMQLLLDRQSDTYLSVDLRRERVELVAHGQQGTSVLASVENPNSAARDELQFSVEVRAGELAVDVAGQRLIQLELAERRLEGPWGLGVSRGGAGLWRRLRVSNP